MTDLDLLREVWSALGCARNPDDFKPSVQSMMREQALGMIRDYARHGTSLHRENRKLVEALRACGSVPTDRNDS